jgi:hypothetical protein
VPAAVFRALTLSAALALSGRAEATPLPLRGSEAEQFLRRARVLELKPLGVGVTHSEKATLSDGVLTLKAVWKTINEFRPGMTELERGHEMDFRDSYKYEIAAYELDKILGLDLVPPTVDRVIDRHPGALQLWVEDAMTEADRKARGLKTGDPARWNDQMYKVRLLHQLTRNTDFNNIRNILIDPDFRIYAIDHSRAFRLQHELLSERDLTRFSRTVLEKLRRLDRQTVEEKLGAWLSDGERKGLLARGALILRLAEKQIAERGEAAVLYPERP